MYKLVKFLLLLLSASSVFGSPFYDYKQIAATENEKKPEPQQELEVHRLSELVEPIAYELRIVPDLEKFTFNGKVEITVMVILSTSKIELHSKGLKIISLKLVRGTRPVSQKYTLDETNDLLVIETVEKLSYNTDYTIVIEFEGTLNDNMKGFYRSSYTVNGKEKWLATTQFEPIYARQAFPCFDEPRFRAPFTVYVGRFENQQSISNMPRETVLPKDSNIGNRVWEKFQQSPPMPTYLVAFMVSNFSYVTDSEKKVNVWARENALDQASYALKQSSKLLSQLEGYTGISFKLPKMEVVAIPDFSAGAMENWGMTTYREKYVLLNETKSSAQQKSGVTEVISHEFAHQWFGDLVTPAWWDYLWLNEGFATYFEYFNAAEVEPSWNLDSLFVVEAVQSALWSEVTRQRAMTTSITTNSGIQGAFDVISYPKAGSVIRMLEHIVSPSSFRTALHNYLKNGHEKHGGVVEPELLWKEFDLQAYRDSPHIPPHVKVSQIMRTWTENIGYPLITVKRNYTTGKVEITQSTYKSPRAPKPAPDQEWIVPITYTTKSELKFSETKPKQWSFANKVEVLKKQVPSNDWVIVNIQQSAYFRVNYDLDNWKRIISHLREKHEDIHVLNRAQIIDDTLSLAADDVTCYHRPLQVLQYISNEKEWIPWYSAVIGLNALYSKYEATSTERPLRDFITNIIRGPYTTFGFDIKPTHSHLEKKIKPLFLALACNIGFEGCTKNALEEYNKNKNDLSKVQPDLQKVIFCNALRYSVDQVGVYNNLWDFYTKSDSAYDKNVVLMSLSCATNQEVINRILSKFVDSKNKEIRLQDKVFITRLFFLQIPAVTGSIVYADSKVSVISELDQDSLSSFKEILESISNNVKTQDQIQKLKKLQEKFKLLDQNKYGSLTKIIQEAQTKGTNTIKDTEVKAEELGSIIREFLQPDTTAPTAGSTPPPTKAPTPSSGASMLVSSIWSHLTVAAITAFYGLPLLRTL